MNSKREALRIWTMAGFTAEQAWEWMTAWGGSGPTCDTAEDEEWMAEQARLWHDCGFTGHHAHAWAPSEIAGVLGTAIQNRVHGLTVDDEDGRGCPGLFTFTGQQDDDDARLIDLYGFQDRDSVLVRWATRGLPDDRILAYWHAGIPLQEALTGGHDDGAVDILAALNTPSCPLLQQAA